MFSRRHLSNRQGWDVSEGPPRRHHQNKLKKALLLLSTRRVEPSRPRAGALRVFSRQQRDFLHKRKLRLQHEKKTLSADPVAQFRAAAAYPRIAPCTDDFHLVADIVVKTVR